MLTILQRSVEEQLRLRRSHIEKEMLMVDLLKLITLESIIQWVVPQD